MSRAVMIWTASVAVGLLIAVAQKMFLNVSAEVGLATVALFVFGAGPVAARVGSLFETSRSRRNRSVRLVAI